MLDVSSVKSVAVKLLTRGCFVKQKSVRHTGSFLTATVPRSNACRASLNVYLGSSAHAPAYLGVREGRFAPCVILRAPKNGVERDDVERASGKLAVENHFNACVCRCPKTLVPGWPQIADSI
jgi:hypothetical protein